METQHEIKGRNLVNTQILKYRICNLLGDFNFKKFFRDYQFCSCDFIDFIFRWLIRLFVV